jgi:hypothetical protein
MSETTYSRTVEDCSRGILAAGAQLGFVTPTAADVEEARALGMRLVGAVATTDVFERVRSFQPAALLVSRADHRVTGVVATLLLRASGARSLRQGNFNGRDPAMDELCSGPDSPDSYYIWGVGGETRVAKWAAMEFCRRLRHDVFADLIGFTRAATADGRRAAVARLGFVPLTTSDDSLLVSPPVIARCAA